MQSGQLVGESKMKDLIGSLRWAKLLNVSLTYFYGMWINVDHHLVQLQLKQNHLMAIFVVSSISQ